MNWRGYMIIAAFMAVAVFGSLWANRADVHVFEGVDGPAAPSPALDIAPTLPSDYSGGTPSRLAVLLTDRDSNWLGLVHGLKTIGVPFTVTEDTAQAVAHDVVFVYPVISGQVLGPEALAMLRRHPEAGGTLIGTNALGGGLDATFGFGRVEESKARIFLDLDVAHDETGGLTAMTDDRIKIGTETQPELNIGTNSYHDLSHPPLARYEDGAAAITARHYDSGGRAYALGIDLGQLLLRGYNWRTSGIPDSYVNAYQPTLDVLLMLVAEIYRAGQSDAVTLHTVPDGRDLSVVLSHDVDYAKSIRNAVAYARMHRDKGVRSTFFIQTKYVHDYNDEIFIDDSGADYVREIEALGMELASHSVSHSLQFHDMPVGTGKEAYPGYRPRVRSGTQTRGATLLGELRVSKFLLEAFSGDSEVVSFRPGYLRNPDTLPEALQRTGYRYSSSATANMSLTHLPFQLNRGRAFTSELDVFEFPITVEDERDPPMGERLGEATAIADRLASYGGLFVLLNHPDILGHKFAFEEGFIDHVRPYAWVGSMSDFGDFWRARNAVSLDVARHADQLEMTLDAPLPIDGLTLRVPDGLRLPAGGVPSGVRQDGDHIVLPRFEGTLTIKLERRAKAEDDLPR